MVIAKKRINSIDFLDKIDSKKIYIGIRITEDEYKKLGIDEFEEGLSIEPSPNYGINCRRNTEGYSYADKSSEKVYRYITTREWSLLDWGGYEHTGYSDVYRYAYPKIEVSPTNIEMVLTKDKNDRKFIIANIKDYSNKSLLKQIINMFLEVFGYCEVFNEDLDLVKDNLLIKRCNWEILPKGIKIDIKSLKDKKKHKSKNKGFEEYRIETLNKFNPIDIFCGTGGFTGYYAFIFNKYCCLESSYYGNATYVIPVKNWEELSKMSKGDLLSSKYIIKKINHNENWHKDLVDVMREVNN